MAWWRSYVRKKTGPINPVDAMRMKKILSCIYFFAAWNAFSYGAYLIFKSNYVKGDELKKNPTKFYATLLGTPDAKVIRLKGLTVVNEYLLTGTERPEPGRTREERELEEKQRQERERAKKENKSDQEDLELLIEETGTL